jgi:HEAT repeat protein
VLVAIASDAGVTRLRRNRAISALGFVPSAAARAYLAAVLDEKGAAAEGADALDAAAALSALWPYGADALPLLTRFLAHASGDVRYAAAVALGRTALPEAAAWLRARYLAERDASVRAAVARSLKQLERR